MHASTDEDSALSWGKVSNIGFILIPIFLLHFTLIYPKPVLSEKNRKFINLAYVPVLLIIILMITTTSMFTVASTSQDLLIDGNGDNPGRGDYEFPEYPYKPLMKYELGLWFYIDENNNNEFDVINDTSEDLQRINVVLVGDGLNANGTPGSWLPLESANNSANIYWIDVDESMEDHTALVYNNGEDIYLDSGDKKLNPVVLGEEIEPWGNYDYEPQTFYILLILFFFIYLLAAIANLINQYLKLTEEKEKQQTAYLSIGLIFIIVFIVSYNFVGPYVSVAILDSILTVTIAFFFAIAVLKYNLMDIQVIIKRSLFFSIIFMIIAVIFVVVGELLEYLIGELIEGTIEIVTNIFSALMVSVMFVPVTKYVRKFTDMLFPEARRYEQEYKNRIAAYGATLEAMWADGSISEKEADALKILREKLELTEDDHYQIERKYRKRYAK